MYWNVIFMLVSSEYAQCEGATSQVAESTVPVNGCGHGVNDASSVPTADILSASITYACQVLLPSVLWNRH